MEEDKEKREKEDHRWFMVGKSAGYDEVSKVLFEDSASFFVNSQDDMAKLLRNYGKKFRAKSEELHPGK